MNGSRFAEILERADKLPLEDQETLIEVLRSRARDRRRTEVIKDSREAQKELREGSCRPSA